MDALQSFVGGLTAPLALAAVAALALATGLLYVLLDAVRYAGIPSLDVPLKDDERSEVLDAETYKATKKTPAGQIPCYDPASMQFLGFAEAMTPAEVRATIAKAKQAAGVWRQSTFAQRRQLLRILLKYIIDHQEDICRVSVRESGKTKLDASLGEIVVTAEKLTWLIGQGEQALRPVHRRAGTMAFYKHNQLEFVPMGVIGAIVPWNWPFHNILNPISAAVFAGNAIVIKVSEHSSWSVDYFNRFMQAALAAAGAPADLVSFVTGYGDAGNALVTGGVDNVIFVGSTEVGRKVMAAASAGLTPVTLELGGKDAFIVCDDADLGQVVPIAVKAAFLNAGQNCAGGERFFVQSGVYDAFVGKVTDNVRAMRQGASSTGGGPVDVGAMAMPGLAEKVQGLVDDAVAKGARALTGGRVGVKDSPGQYFQPTVLVGVTRDMDIWREEVFGPVMCVVPFATDEEAVALANDCPFGLGSSVFTGSQARGRAMASRLEAGMVSINDFNATYTCQGLPFGGVKDSGFGRFAGVEGLRSLCHMKSVSEDVAPWLMKTAIPPLWLHPVGAQAPAFARALTTMFYGPSLGVQARGLGMVLSTLLAAAREGGGSSSSSSGGGGSGEGPATNGKHKGS